MESMTSARRASRRASPGCPITSRATASVVRASTAFGSSATARRSGAIASATCMSLTCTLDRARNASATVESSARARAALVRASASSESIAPIPVVGMLLYAIARFACPRANRGSRATAAAKWRDAASQLVRSLSNRPRRNSSYAAASAVPRRGDPPAGLTSSSFDTALTSESWIAAIAPAGPSNVALQIASSVAVRTSSAVT